jgi:putative NADH-flavin reductase
MSKVVVFGASGYTGGNIARELVSRGHEVIGVARDGSKITDAGVQVRAGDLADEAFFASAIAGADVAILAVHHRSPEVSGLLPALLDLTAAASVRLGVIGGAGSLHVAEGGPRLIDTAEFPDAYKPEAGAAAASLERLRELNRGDWFFISPAGGYGKFAPGERTGAYRLGGDVLVTDAEGKSFIGGEDFAIAVADEIETPQHHNVRFTVGY